ncbi:MAG TPA: SLC13/DASS family transporter [Firmicutes bacterium]|nr:SLC13/DASS family transporter [Bacillota bacterium]
MSQITITLLILVGAIICFITELVPLGITPLIVLSSLAVFKVLPPSEVLTGFSNNTTILVLFMCPVGEALFRTGVCNWLGEKTIRIAGKNEVKLIGMIMVVAACMSGFTSNTGTAIVMAPLVMSIASEAGASPSRLLMPLAYGASFGGMLTLVGTPPNVIVQGALQEAAGISFGFFDFAKVSLPVVVMAIVYMMTIGRKQVPDRLPAKLPSQEGLPNRKGKMGIAVAIVVLVITGMLFENRISAYGLTLPIIAMVGAVLTVATGCITMDEFTGSIEWSAVLLMGGMQPLGLAMQKW